MANQERESTIKQLDRQFKRIKLGTAAAILTTSIGTVGLVYVSQERGDMTKEPPRVEDVNTLNAIHINSKIMVAGGGIGTALWLTALGLNRRNKRKLSNPNKGC